MWLLLVIILGLITDFESSFVGGGALLWTRFVCSGRFYPCLDRLVWTICGFLLTAGGWIKNYFGVGSRCWRINERRYLLSGWPTWGWPHKSRRSANCLDNAPSNVYLICTFLYTVMYSSLWFLSTISLFIFIVSTRLVFFPGSLLCRSCHRSFIRLTRVPTEILKSLRYSYCTWGRSLLQIHLSLTDWFLENTTDIQGVFEYL